MQKSALVKGDFVTLDECFDVEFAQGSVLGPLLISFVYKRHCDKSQV